MSHNSRLSNTETRSSLTLKPTAFMFSFLERSNILRDALAILTLCARTRWRNSILRGVVPETLSLSVSSCAAELTFDPSIPSRLVWLQSIASLCLYLCMTSWVCWTCVRPDCRWPFLSQMKHWPVNCRVSSPVTLPFDLPWPVPMAKTSNHLVAATVSCTGTMNFVFHVLARVNSTRVHTPHDQHTITTIVIWCVGICCFSASLCVTALGHGNSLFSIARPSAMVVSRFSHTRCSHQDRCVLLAVIDVCLLSVCACVVFVLWVNIGWRTDVFNFLRVCFVSRGFCCSSAQDLFEETSDLEAQETLCWPLLRQLQVPFAHNLPTSCAPQEPN